VRLNSFRCQNLQIFSEDSGGNQQVTNLLISINDKKSISNYGQKIFIENHGQNFVTKIDSDVVFHGTQKQLKDTLD
jgi:hypothetical protein